MLAPAGSLDVPLGGQMLIIFEDILPCLLGTVIRTFFFSEFILIKPYNHYIFGLLVLFFSDYKINACLL